MKRARITFAILAALGAVGALGVTSPAVGKRSTSEATYRVNVNMTEYAFRLSKARFPAGSTVVFTVRNRGDQTHNFVIKRVNKGTRLLASGRTARLTVRFPRRGVYGYICTVSQHAVEGMTGNIRIT